MRPRIFLPGVFLLFGLPDAAGQRIFEWGFKPSELAVRNLEVHASAGWTPKAQVGIILAYRPSTRDSGLIRTEHTGSVGGYGFNHANKLYEAFTVGVFQKTYINKASDIFLGSDLLYRLWTFDKKPARFENSDGYRFDGIRTERVRVYALKLLAGVTCRSKKTLGRGRPYFDFYTGIGVRYKKQIYKTYEGFVNDVFYHYREERFYNTWPSLHVGARVGLQYHRRLPKS